MNTSVSQYDIQKHYGGVPLKICIASQNTRGNCALVFEIASTRRDGNDRPHGTILTLSNRFHLFVPIPYKIARRAVRDFEKLNRFEMSLNMTDENIPLLVKFYRSVQPGTKTVFDRDKMTALLHTETPFYAQLATLIGMR